MAEDIGPANQDEAEENKEADQGKDADKEVSLEKDENGKVIGIRLPGIHVNIAEKLVDVESTVTMSGGFLELIACTADTKEHESIIRIDAKAKHVHAALLLLNIKPGNPAIRRLANAEGTRWVDIPPRGDKVDAFLVVKKEGEKPKEYPINHFIIMGEDYESYDNDKKEGELEKFPTHTFVFAGSGLTKRENKPPRYWADDSGNVISIVTFGDEVLTLPDIHGHANESLVWEVDATDLPPLESKVTLRLRPHVAKGKEENKGGEELNPKDDK